MSENVGEDEGVPSKGPLLLVCVGIVVIAGMFIPLIGALFLVTASAQDACDVAESAGVGGGSQDLAEGEIPAEYVEDIKDAAKVSGVPASVLAAQIQQESGFNPNACSPAGACGIAQFVEGTWQRYSHGADRNDGHAGIRAQGEYMRDLMNTIAGVSKTSGKSQVELALAAYNAGEGAVLQNHGIPPFAETQNYVQVIMGSAAKFRDAVDDSADKANAATVDLAGSDITIETVAETTADRARIDSGEHLQKDAYQLARAVQQEFPEVKSIGGWRPTDAIAQDHPNGQAVDIMVPDYTSDAGKRLGQEINHYVWDNASRFHVTYSIWRQDLYNSSADQPYSHMEDRGSDTQNHMDHVHVTVEGHGQNDGTAGSIPKRSGFKGVELGDASKASNPECEDASAVGGYSGGETSGNDDYAWKSAQGVHDESGFYYGQCTDFAWWRLNQQLGGSQSKIVVTNTSFAPGHRLGNGGEWDETWTAKGWPVDSTPEVGAMAVFEKGVSGADPTYGHIGVVKEIKGDRVVIEEYNALVPSGYGTREMDAGAVSHYLHIPDDQKKGK